MSTGQNVRLDLYEGCLAGGERSACLPLLEAKVLQLPPALGDNEFTLGSPESVSSAATQVRLVVLGVSHPIEDLLGEDVLSKPGCFGANLVEQRAREEDWDRSACLYRTWRWL